MLRKLIYITGLIMSLLAAEGLNRIGGLVAAFKGDDAGFYQAFLIIAIVAAGIFLLSLFIKINAFIKWIIFLALLVCSVLMLNAPSLPVNIQIIIGLSASAIASLFIKNVEPKDKA